jgi:hypothetical protein
MLCLCNTFFGLEILMFASNCAGRKALALSIAFSFAALVGCQSATTPRGTASGATDAAAPRAANADDTRPDPTGRYLRYMWGAVPMEEVDALTPERCKGIRDARRVAAAGNLAINVTCEAASIADRLPITAVLRDGAPTAELLHRFRTMNVCVKALAEPTIQSQNIVRTCTE